MIDELDEQIIHLLEEDASQSSRVYAKRLHTSPATIRRRITKLLKDDVIRIKAVCDPGKAGRNLSVLMIIDIDHKNINAAIKLLAGMGNVEWLATTTGRYHIALLLRFRSMEELYTFLREDLSRIEGLHHDEAFVCLNVVKAPYIHK